MKEELKNALKTAFKTIGIDIIVGIFLVAGLWTISNGVLVLYAGFYSGNGLPQPSELGNTLFWFIEGLFFIYLAAETRKYRKIKIG